MGLMGEIASTVYAGLGEENVIGVIPEALQPREVWPPAASPSLHCYMCAAWDAAFRWPCGIGAPAMRKDC